MKAFIFCLGILTGCGSTMPAVKAPPVDVCPAFPSASRDPINLHKRVCVDASFDQEDRDDIEEALHAWNKALGSDLQMAHEGCDWHIVYAKRDNFYGILSPLTLAYGVIGGDTIQVLRWRMHGQAKFRQVLMHEMGHLLGSDHSKNEQGLMAEHYWPHEYQCIDPWTVSQVAIWQANEGKR
jgi:hypothetical protein